MQAVFRQLSQLYVDLQVISGAAVGICYGSFLGIQLVATRARVCKLHECIAATLPALRPPPTHLRVRPRCSCLHAEPDAGAPSAYSAKASQSINCPAGAQYAARLLPLVVAGDSG